MVGFFLEYFYIMSKMLLHLYDLVMLLYSESRISCQSAFMNMISLQMGGKSLFWVGEYLIIKEK